MSDSSLPPSAAPVSSTPRRQRRWVRVASSLAVGAVAAAATVLLVPSAGASAPAVEPAGGTVCTAADFHITNPEGTTYLLVSLDAACTTGVNVGVGPNIDGVGFIDNFPLEPGKSTKVTDPVCDNKYEADTADDSGTFIASGTIKVAALCDPVTVDPTPTVLPTHTPTETVLPTRTITPTPSPTNSSSTSVSPTKPSPTVSSSSTTVTPTGTVTTTTSTSVSPTGSTTTTTTTSSTDSSTSTTNSSSSTLPTFPTSTSSMPPVVTLTSTSASAPTCQTGLSDLTGDAVVNIRTLTVTYTVSVSKPLCSATTFYGDTYRLPSTYDNSGNWDPTAGTKDNPQVYLPSARADVVIPKNGVSASVTKPISGTPHCGYFQADVSKTRQDTVIFPDGNAGNINGHIVLLGMLCSAPVTTLPTMTSGSTTSVSSTPASSTSASSTTAPATSTTATSGTASTSGTVSTSGTASTSGTSITKSTTSHPVLPPVVNFQVKFDDRLSCKPEAIAFVAYSTTFLPVKVTVSYTAGAVTKSATLSSFLGTLTVLPVSGYGTKTPITITVSYTDRLGVFQRSTATLYKDFSSCKPAAPIKRQSNPVIPPVVHPVAPSTVVMTIVQSANVTAPVVVPTKLDAGGINLGPVHQFSTAAKSALVVLVFFLCSLATYFIRPRRPVMVAGIELIGGKHK